MLSLDDSVEEVKPEALRSVSRRSIGGSSKGGAGAHSVVQRPTAVSMVKITTPIAGYFLLLCTTIFFLYFIFHVFVFYYIAI